MIQTVRGFSSFEAGFLAKEFRAKDWHRTMQRSLLTENFSSLELRNHYYDLRAQAFAFLVTVGSKALVLEEQKIKSVINYEGINDEAEIRAQMVNEERIRSIRRRIMSKSALQVLKRGRDEKLRTVDIVLHQDRKKGTFLSWRSKLNYAKKFDITSGTIVSKFTTKELSQNRNSTLSSPASPTSSKRGSTSFEVVDISKLDVKKRTTRSMGESSPASVLTNGSASFLRLKNQSRTLDLSFQSNLELEAFLLILQKTVGVQVQPEVLQINASPAASP